MPFKGAIAVALKAVTHVLEAFKNFMVERKCALCKEVRPLCDSHFIPAAIYKNLLDPSGPIKNMIVSDGNTASERSDQVSQHLLCEECELRFQQGGETWLLARRLMPDGKFLLRDTLRSKPSARKTSNGDVVYELVSIPEAQPDQLVYFAISVIWRGAVADWDLPTSKYLRLNLPADLLEAMRMYLLGKQPLPPDVTLMLHISSADKPLQTCFFPLPVDASGKSFHFYIPGLLFTFMFGPGSLVGASVAHSPNPVAISSTGDLFMSKVGIRHASKSEPTNRLKDKLPRT